MCDERCNTIIWMMVIKFSKEYISSSYEFIVCCSFHTCNTWKYWKVNNDLVRNNFLFLLLFWLFCLVFSVFSSNCSHWLLNSWRFFELAPQVFPIASLFNTQRHEKLLHVTKKESIKEETYMTVVLTSEELRIEVLRLRLIMGSCDFRELHIFSMHGKLSCFNFFKKKIFCFSHGGIEVWAS